MDDFLGMEFGNNWDNFDMSDIFGGNDMSLFGDVTYDDLINYGNEAIAAGDVNLGADYFNELMSDATFTASGIETGVGDSMTMEDYLGQLAGVLPSGILSALKGSYDAGGLSGKTVSDVLKGVVGSTGGSWLDKLMNMGRMAGETAAAIPQRYSSQGKLWDTYYQQTKDKANGLLNLAGTVPELSGMLDPAFDKAQGKINTAGANALSSLDQFGGDLMTSALNAGNNQMDIYQALGINPASGLANRTMATTLSDKFAAPMLQAGAGMIGQTEQGLDTLWNQYPQQTEKFNTATATTKGSILAQVPNMEQKLGYETKMEPDQWGLAGAGLKFASTMPDFFKSLFSSPTPAPTGGTT